MVIDKVVIRLYTNKNLNETELESLSEDLNELDIKQKIYSSIRELLRERIHANYGIDIEVD